MTTCKKTCRASDIERLVGEMKSWQQRLGDTLSLTVENPIQKEIDLIWGVSIAG